MKPLQPLTNLDVATKVMDLAARRMELIASNMANVDTPGYRTRDIDFAAELKRAVSAETGTAKSAPSHTVAGLLERPDGNNVSLERENMIMASTQLQFAAASQLLRQQFKQLQSAIQDGRG